MSFWTPKFCTVSFLCWRANGHDGQCTNLMGEPLDVNRTEAPPAAPKTDDATGPTVPQENIGA